MKMSHGRFSVAASTFLKPILDRRPNEQHDRFRRVDLFLRQGCASRFKGDVDALCTIAALAASQEVSAAATRLRPHWLNGIGMKYKQLDSINRRYASCINLMCGMMREDHVTMLAVFTGLRVEP